jgi:hypothetical protein
MCAVIIFHLKMYTKSNGYKLLKIYRKINTSQTYKLFKEKKTEIFKSYTNN